MTAPRTAPGQERTPPLPLTVVEVPPRPQGARAPEGPLSGPAAFAAPVLPGPSPRLLHAPFLAWLADVLRPRLVVELGCDEAGHVALREAVGGPGRCVAVRVPGGPEAPAAEPVEAEAGRAADLVGEGGVDLLVLDAAAGLVLTPELLDTWGPKLAAGAVVVVHGAGPDRTAPLRERHPTIGFDHGAGLSAHLVGSDHPEALVRLAALAPEDPEREATAAGLRRLGEALEAQARHRADLGRLAQAEAALAAERERARGLAAALEAREAQAARGARLEEAERSLAERFDEIATLTRMLDLERRRTKAIRRRRAELSRRIAEDREAARAAGEERTRRAAATRGLVDALRDLEAEAGHEELRRRAAEVEAGHRALLASRSWRLAARVSRAAARLSREPLPPAAAARGAAALLDHVEHMEARHGAALRCRSWRTIRGAARLVGLRTAQGVEGFEPRAPALRASRERRRLLAALATAAARDDA